jgi:hypothetical protein
MRTLAALVVLSFALMAQASVAFETSVEDLARSSQAVVRGKVVKTYAQWKEEPTGSRIYTYAEVEATSVWRGAPAGTRVTVITPGGIVGDLGQRVYGAATFTKGEEVVVFLFEGQDRGLYRVSGLAQGKFTVKDGAAAPQLQHVERIPGQLGRGERRAEAMGVDELERRVRSVQ